MGTLVATQDALAGLLPESGADAIKQAGRSCWRLAFSNGEVRTAIAVADGDWMTLQARPPAACKRSSSPQHLWDYLENNHGLPGGVKFVLMPQDRYPRIRVDVPLEEGTCTAEAVREAGQGLKAAFHCLGKAQESKPSLMAARNDGAQTEPSDLEGLCTSSGWAFARRGSGHLAIELESPGGACHAILAPRGQGAAASVHLAACQALGEKPRLALAILLLTACGLVRMIRATAVQEEGRMVLGFEVVMDATPTAQELDRGLSALSVAVRLCGPQEVAGMLDESIADRYLAIRGWAS